MQRMLDVPESNVSESEDLDSGFSGQDHLIIALVLLLVAAFWVALVLAPKYVLMMLVAGFSCLIFVLLVGDNIETWKVTRFDPLLRLNVWGCQRKE